MKKLAIVHLSTLGILFVSVVFWTTRTCAQVSTCQIEGRIVDHENKPVPFAAVIVKTAGGLTRATSATDSGAFRLDGLKPGRCVLTVQRVGFEQQSRDVEVSVGQTSSVSFTMTPREETTEQAEALQRSNSAEPGLGVQAIQWYSFEDGIALAQQTNKKLLVDVYTDWCGWCKKMDKEVYTNRQVSEAIQSHFVAVKINAESDRELTYAGRRGSEKALAQRLGVNSYPTTVFLNPGGQLLTKVSGYIQSDEFVKLLQYVAQK